MGITRVSGRVRPWRVQYYTTLHESGRLVRRRTSKYFSSRRHAIAFYHARALEDEALAAGLSSIVPADMDRLVAELVAGHFSHKSARYLKGEAGRLHAIAAYWAGQPVHTITAPDVTAFLHGLLDRGLSTKTVKNYHGLLSLIFRQAKLRQHVGESPMDHVPAPRVVPRREVTALTDVELAKLIRAGGRPEHAEVVRVCLLMIHTGVRLGELLRVRVERDVDAAANVLRVRSVEGAATKNAKPRTIPLSPVARELLAGTKVGPIWGLTGRALDARLRKLGKELGVHLHAHRFRHTFCSLNMANGVPAPVVTSWLGHGSSQITQRYTHLSGHDQRWATLDIGKKLGSDWAQVNRKQRTAT